MDSTSLLRATLNATSADDRCACERRRQTDAARWGGMLSVLDYELQNSVADRFDATIDAPGGRSEPARNLRIYRDVMLKADGRLPLQTAENDGATLAKKDPAVYSWRYSRKVAMGITRAHSTVFSFYDNAGGDFATPDKALSQIYGRDHAVGHASLLRWA